MLCQLSYTPVGQKASQPSGKLAFIPLATARRDRRPQCLTTLLNYFRDDARTYRATTFANSEANAIVHSDRLVQFDRDLDVVARHAHFCVDQVGRARDVRRAEVELGTIAAEEWCVTTTFVLRQAVNLGLELRVWRNRAGLRQHLTTLNFVALDTSQQAAGRCRQRDLRPAACETFLRP